MDFLILEDIEEILDCFTNLSMGKFLEGELCIDSNKFYLLDIFGEFTNTSNNGKQRKGVCTFEIIIAEPISAAPLLCDASTMENEKAYQKAVKKEQKALAGYLETLSNVMTDGYEYLTSQGVYYRYQELGRKIVSIDKFSDTNKYGFGKVSKKLVEEEYIGVGARFKMQCCLNCIPDQFECINLNKLVKRHKKRCKTKRKPKEVLFQSAPVMMSHGMVSAPPPQKKGKILPTERPQVVKLPEPKELDDYAKSIVRAAYEKASSEYTKEQNNGAASTNDVNQKPFRLEHTSQTVIDPNEGEMTPFTRTYYKMVFSISGKDGGRSLVSRFNKAIDAGDQQAINQVEAMILTQIAETVGNVGKLGSRVKKWNGKLWITGFENQS